MDASRIDARPLHGPSRQALDAARSRRSSPGHVATATLMIVPWESHSPMSANQSLRLVLELFHVGG